MKILVTGPDGLLGSSLVRELLKDGYEVKAFVFPGSRSQTLEGLPIERFYGTILKQSDLLEAMAGCDAVIHAAANTNVWPTRSEKIRQVNFLGTQNAVEAALQRGVKRFIYVSSASSYHHGSKQTPGNETQPFTGSMYRLDYIDSKYQAQEYVLEAVRKRGLPGVVINPTFMFGEFDSMPSSGRMILAIYHGKVPGYTGGGKNFVYARDVARAIVNALTLGRIGECYIAGNVNLHYKELFEIIAREVGVKPPRMRFPAPFMRLVGWFGTASGKLFRRAPAINHSTAQISCDSQFYSPEKAVRELKMPQTEIASAIRSAFEWLKSNNYC